MNLNECYELLGVTDDFNSADIESVYSSKVTEYTEKYNKGEMNIDDYYSMIKKLGNAKEILINSNNSKKRKSGTRADKTGARAAKKTKSAGGNALKKGLLAVGAVAIIGGSITVGWFLNDYFDKKDTLKDMSTVGTIVTETQSPTPEITTLPEVTNTPEVTEKPEVTATPGLVIIPETTGTPEVTRTPEVTNTPEVTRTPEVTNAPEVKEVKPMVLNYGDISNEALVIERATNLANQLGTAGVINMNTGVPYTVDELIKVNKFICGAYVPENESEAYSMVNDYLNFCLMDSELTIAFANVNGIDWDNIEDPAFLNALKNTDLPNLQRLQETTPKIMIVDNMLYGDVSVAAYNYLKMFETRYQEMIYSTDQKLCDDIYLDLTYSLTRLRVNGEYTFTWNNEEYTVTMNDFSGRDKVNAGNILQYYVFMYQTAFSKIDEAKVNELGNSVYNGMDDPSGDNYTYTYIPGEVHGDTVDDSEHLIGYHDENISLDESVNYADHKYFETTEYFNAACYEGLRLEDIALDDEGYVFLLGDQPAQNFSTINQINSINAALANYYAKGLDYYNQTFNKTLKK